MSFPNGTSSIVTFKWTVTGLRTSDEGDNKDAVVQTYWKKIGTDEDGNEGTFTGATPFTSANVPEGQFVPYEDLTEETVVSWIQPVTEEEPYRTHINDTIKKFIAEKRGFRKQPQRMPWQPEDVTPPVPDPARNPL